MQRERIHTLFIILYYTNTWLGTRHTQIQIKDISVDALFVGVVSSLEIVQKNNSLLCELKTFRYWNFACIDDYVDESLPVLCANVVMQPFTEIGYFFSSLYRSCKDRTELIKIFLKAIFLGLSELFTFDVLHLSD